MRVITAWDSLRHRLAARAARRLHGRAPTPPARRCCSASATRAAPSARSAGACPACKEFTKEFLKYRKRYPWVKDWLTWNEANHCGEPTCHKPRRVARFYNNIGHNCYGCNVVGGDVLDTPTMTAVGARRSAARPARTS